MRLTLANEGLTLQVNTLGGEMMSLKSLDGVEYLWQGDPAFWDQRAPILFPFIGRLTGGGYRYRGTFYPLPQHGFAASSEFSVSEHSESTLSLVLEDSAETRACYPFPFRLTVAFRLAGQRVFIRFAVENTGAETMPFGIGGHPGFRVPLLPAEHFEDYEIRFETPCRPDRVGFTEKVFLSGVDTPYPLENGVRLPLTHSLFDEDAIILKNMARGAVLQSRTSGRGLEVTFPSLPYFGIWHWPRKEAPYICLEPWSSLPSRQDVEEEISCKSDLIHLPAGETWQADWSILVF